MASHSDHVQGVHFVVRHQGKLHVTDDSYVYDPAAPDLTADDVAAIDYLKQILGTGDVALLDNSRLKSNPGWKVGPPHPHPDRD